MKVPTRIITFMILICGAMFAPGCGGGGKSAPSSQTTALQNSPPGPFTAGFVGRVVLSENWNFPTIQIAALTPEMRTELQAGGVQFDGNVLKFPVIGMRGVWIRINGKALMTDKDGYFNLVSMPTGASQGQVFKTLNDAQPLISFNLNTLVPAGKPVPPIQLTYQVSPPGDMNPVSFSKAAGLLNSPASKVSTRLTLPGTIRELSNVSFFEKFG